MAKPKRGKWYLSGAVSNDPDFRLKFNYAEYQLKQKGFKVLNPVKGEKDGKAWDYYMRKDIRKLTKCDGIILMDDWFESKGARLEKKVAEELGMKILRLNVISGEITEWQNG
jgi:hypothetical protein